MAISYALDIATATPAIQVARALDTVARAVGLFHASVTPELLVGEGVVTGRGTWIRVGEKTPQPWNPVITDLGFTPRVWVVFRFDKFSDSSGQQDDMVRLVSGLLERVTGDAVLHFDFEVVWLLRRGGELSLNERDDIWPPQRLAAVSLPYRRATYAFS
ncbi:hypothetical protein P3T37_004136 [Kitasatospora sp. MAA4]|uniref:SitI3 family protein n=1 Tax=Kitasatospora sp. MAA4 TaxID=3035093 RepID=UPI0024763B03|nr:SitI3 family protein [Kitasatospora sp. MAA4]MDH6134732.1 hypothetical protein [Kitasatospora sp. MAA4]